jgi:GT2 family glycosyltransferase
VAVAIVGFRNPDDIRRCLSALGDVTHADFEVIICENGGEAAYAALLAGLPSVLPGGQPVRIIRAPGNLGFAGGVNVCLAQSPGADAWWILNPDTQPEPHALTAMVERLAAGDCDAVGCLLYLPDDQIQCLGGRWRPWFARAESLGKGQGLAVPVDPMDVERRQNYLNGASMLVGRRFLETVGPMREDYFLYCEEVEWCLRGRAKGLRLGFAPGARVLHAQGTTTGAGRALHSQPRLPIYLGERNKMLLTRDLFAGRLGVAALASLALLALRYARRGAWRQFGYGVAGWWAGLRGRRGPPAWISV